MCAGASQDVVSSQSPKISHSENNNHNGTRTKSSFGTENNINTGNTARNDASPPQFAGHHEPQQQCPPPNATDVCMDVEDHPGTLAFCQIVKASLHQFPNVVEYSPPVYKKIKKQLKRGQRMLICVHSTDENTQDSPSLWREATQPERIDFVGKCFEEERSKLLLRNVNVNANVDKAAVKEEGKARLQEADESPKSGDLNATRVQEASTRGDDDKMDSSSCGCCTESRTPEVKEETSDTENSNKSVPPRRITFSNAIQVVICIPRVLDSELDLFYYDKMDIAQFRHEAWCEDNGIDASGLDDMDRTTHQNSSTRSVRKCTPDVEEEKGDVSFSDYIEVFWIPRVDDSEIDLLYYDDYEIAQFRDEAAQFKHEARCKTLGLHSTDFDYLDTPSFHESGPHDVLGGDDDDDDDGLPLEEHASFDEESCIESIEETESHEEESNGTNRPLYAEAVGNLANAAQRPPPNATDDVCIDVQDHPGTLAFLQIVKTSLDRIGGVDYSPPVYKLIKRQLKGRRMLICVNTTKTSYWRDAAQAERIDYVGKCFENERSKLRNANEAEEVAARLGAGKEERTNPVVVTECDSVKMWYAHYVREEARLIRLRASEKESKKYWSLNRSAIR
jgi:hypothetical protein